VAFHPSQRPRVGDWKNEVRRRAAPLMASWNQAMAQAEDELRAEGRYHTMIHEVEERARAILTRPKGAR